MPLSKGHIQRLKAEAHHLKPVVMIGSNGLTENVLKEIDIALEHHELIKVKIASAEKEERLACGTEIAEQMKAEVIGLIGHILILYRRAKKDK